MKVYPICKFFAFLLILYELASAEDQVTEFTKMLQGELSKARNYQQPANNSRLLKTCSPLYHNYGTFDFIVIGSGSAGAIVANRLSEIKGWKILLLEAGGLENEFSKVPSFFSFMTFTDYNWGYQTTQQLFSCQGFPNQQCTYARGLIRGGTSSINAAIHVRGNEQDYDMWAAMGNTGWSYDEVLPYFKKLEDATFEDHESEYRGKGGYVTIQRSEETPGVKPLLSQGFQEIGVPTILDYNGEKQIGLSTLQYNMKYNKRAGTSAAYLDRVQDRDNLHVSLNSFVTKILIHKYSKSAYGVNFIKNCKKHIARARKEVILSAGFINSPQILMLSGIGPKEHLGDLGINVVEDLPVGKFFQDHPLLFSLKYRTNEVFYNMSLEKQVELYFQNKKPLTTAMEYTAFLNSKQIVTERPDIQIITSTPIFDTTAFGTEQGDDHPTDLGVTPIVLHPDSKGSIRLKSKSPMDMPLIDSNMLSDPKGADLEKFYKAIEYLIALNNTRTFRCKGVVLQYSKTPQCDAQYKELSKDWWICFIKTWSVAGMHGVGTTRMGLSSSISVVNPRLKVHGVRQLRVVDAGVIPDLPSGNPNAPVMMVGEKAADLIKQDYGKL